MGERLRPSQRSSNASSMNPRKSVRIRNPGELLRVNPLSVDHSDFSRGESCPEGVGLTRRLAWGELPNERVRGRLNQFHFHEIAQAGT